MVAHLGVFPERCKYLLVSSRLQVEESRLQPLVLARDPADVAESAAVYIVHADDVGVGAKGLQDRRCRRRAGGECKGRSTARFD